MHRGDAEDSFQWPWKSSLDIICDVKSGLFWYIRGSANFTVDFMNWNYERVFFFYLGECSMSSMKTPRRNKRSTCCDRDVQHTVNKCNSLWYFIYFASSFLNEYSIKWLNNLIHEITSHKNVKKIITCKNFSSWIFMNQQ